MKFLYFSTAAADGTASDEEIVAIEASRLRLMEAETATTTALWFAASQEDNKDVDNTKVVLTHTSAKHKVAMAAITAAINTGPHSDGFITIADDVNASYVDAVITECTSIAVVEAA